MDELVVDFLADAQDNLAGFDESFAAICNAPQDNAHLNKVLRHIHTIKGACSFLNLPDIETNAHACETLLAEAQANNFNAFDKTAAQVTQHIESIKQSVEALEANLPIIADTNHTFGAVVSPLPVIIELMNEDLSKDIQLSISSEDIALPAGMIAPLRNAIIQLVRNAADHGIEAQNVRTQSGKALHSNIHVGAAQEDNEYIITVRDDGAGLNRQSIEDALLAQGRMDKSTMSAATDEDIYQHIFTAGFTTCDAVNTISGRGIGMDIVQTNVQALGGDIRVHSQENIGTIFTITIPANRD